MDHHKPRGFTKPLGFRLQPQLPVTVAQRRDLLSCCTEAEEKARIRAGRQQERRTTQENEKEDKKGVPATVCGPNQMVVLDLSPRLEPTILWKDGDATVAICCVEDGTRVARSRLTAAGPLEHISPVSGEKLLCLHPSGRCMLYSISGTPLFGVQLPAPTVRAFLISTEHSLVVQFLVVSTDMVQVLSCPRKLSVASSRTKKVPEIALDDLTVVAAIRMAPGASLPPMEVLVLSPLLFLCWQRGCPFAKLVVLDPDAGTLVSRYVPHPSAVDKCSSLSAAGSADGPALFALVGSDRLCRIWVYDDSAGACYVVWSMSAVFANSCVYVVDGFSSTPSTRFCVCTGDMQLQVYELDLHEVRPSGQGVRCSPRAMLRQSAALDPHLWSVAQNCFNCTMVQYARSGHLVGFMATDSFAVFVQLSDRCVSASLFFSASDTASGALSSPPAVIVSHPFLKTCAAVVSGPWLFCWADRHDQQAVPQIVRIAQGASSFRWSPSSTMPVLFFLNDGAPHALSFADRPIAVSQHRLEGWHPPDTEARRYTFSDLFVFPLTAASKDSGPLILLLYARETSAVAVLRVVVSDELLQGRSFACRLTTIRLLVKDRQDVGVPVLRLQNQRLDVATAGNIYNFSLAALVRSQPAVPPGSPLEPESTILRSGDATAAVIAAVYKPDVSRYFVLDGAGLISVVSDDGASSTLRERGIVSLRDSPSGPSLTLVSRDAVFAVDGADVVAISSPALSTLVESPETMLQYADGLLLLCSRSLSVCRMAPFHPRIMLHLVMKKEYRRAYEILTYVRTSPSANVPLRLFLSASAEDASKEAGGGWNVDDLDRVEAVPSQSDAASVADWESLSRVPGLTPAELVELNLLGQLVASSLKSRTDPAFDSFATMAVVIDSASPPVLPPPDAAGSSASINGPLCSWGYHSDAQAALLQALLARDKVSWERFRSVGLPLWIKDPVLLKDCGERLAKSQFLETKDPNDCALMYLALRKKATLTGLFRVSKNERFVNFFAMDFDNDERARTVALKNAYALLSKQKFSLAAAYFLLGGSLSDAISVLCRNAKDIALAIFVCRLFTSTAGRSEEAGRELLQRTVLNFLEEDAGGDMWLRYVALLLIDRRADAAAVLESTVREGSVGEQAPMVAAFLNSNRLMAFDPEVIEIASEHAVDFWFARQADEIVLSLPAEARVLEQAAARYLTRTMWTSLEEVHQAIQLIHARIRLPTGFPFLTTTLPTSFKELLSQVFLRISLARSDVGQFIIDNIGCIREVSSLLRLLEVARDHLRPPQLFQVFIWMCQVLLETGDYFTALVLAQTAASVETLNMNFERLTVDAAAAVARMTAEVAAEESQVPAECGAISFWLAVECIWFSLEGLAAESFDLWNDNSLDEQSWHQGLVSLLYLCRRMSASAMRAAVPLAEGRMLFDFLLVCAAAVFQMADNSRSSRLASSVSFTSLSNVVAFLSPQNSPAAAEEALVKELIQEEARSVASMLAEHGCASSLLPGLFTQLMRSHGEVFSSLCVQVLRTHPLLPSPDVALSIGRPFEFCKFSKDLLWSFVMHPEKPLLAVATRHCVREINYDASLTGRKRSPSFCTLLEDDSSTVSFEATLKRRGNRAGLRERNPSSSSLLGGMPTSRQMRHMGHSFWKVHALDTFPLAVVAAAFPEEEPDRPAAGVEHRHGPELDGAVTGKGDAGIAPVSPTASAGAMAALPSVWDGGPADWTALGHASRSVGRDIPVQLFDMHPSQPLYLSGSQDGTIHVWEWSNPHAVATYRTRSANVAAAPELVAGGSGAPATVIGDIAATAIAAVRFSPDGAKFGALTADGSFMLWRFGAPSSTAPLLHFVAHSLKGNDFVFLESSSSLVVTAGIGAPGAGKRYAATGAGAGGPLQTQTPLRKTTGAVMELCMWDCLLPPPLTNRLSVEVPGGVEPRCLHELPKRNALAIGGKRGELLVFDLRSRNFIVQLNPHTNSLRTMSLERTQQQLLATGSSDGSIRIWNTDTFQEVAHIPEAHPRRTFLGLDGKSVVRNFGVMQVSLTTEHLDSCGSDGRVVRWFLHSQS